MKLPARKNLSRESLRILHRPSLVTRCALALVFVCTLGVCTPGVRTLLAHEVPRHVGVRAYVATLPDRVRMLVQIPMDAVRDVDLPLQGGEALDAARAAPFLRDAARLWVGDGITVRDGTRDLGAPVIVGVRASLPGDRAFDAYATAMQAIESAPYDNTVEIPHGQLRLDVWLEWPATAPVRDLVLVPRWAHLGVRTTTVMQLVRTDGANRVYTFTGDPGALRLDPRWWHAAWRFVGDGMGHMLGGIDHLLFVLCLILPFRQLRPLIGLVTAFTVAHSVTLIASALGWAPDAGWFAPLVEVLIAASIVFMAVENMLGARLERRWRMAFVFGLVHGFGFSAALQDSLHLAGQHVLLSLAAFNVGVELAQVLVLLLAVPVVDWVLTRRVPERAGILVTSAFIAHEAWHWMGARTDALRAQSFTWPVMDAAFLLQMIRACMALLVLLALSWLLESVMSRWAGLDLLRRSSRVAKGAVTGMLVVAVWTVPSTLPAQSAPRTTKAGAYTADQATKGREVFNSMCLGCHTTASHMGTAFELKWFGRPLFDLYDYLSQTMPKTAPGSLTEDEYVWVTAYILRLNGMPPGKIELSAEPAWLKAVRVDSTLRASEKPHTSTSHFALPETP